LDKFPPVLGIITISTVFNKYKKRGIIFVKNVENVILFQLLIISDNFQQFHKKAGKSGKKLLKTC